jgi:bla regulator protein BlaR1
MFVETVFWFHPLVWRIGKRMLEERERACDEEVLRTRCQPRAYADAILRVFRLYAESTAVLWRE